ncbi:hypothetical protein VNO77_24933 [Canavalia gladiata]|uniref:Uncharacterized protein n=1 Tax=Canavalia gladiata TaxID=3824 RepID=A0AAN9L783_CANGL
MITAFQSSIYDLGRWVPLSLLPSFHRRIGQFLQPFVLFLSLSPVDLKMFSSRALYLCYPRGGNLLVLVGILILTDNFEDLYDYRSANTI